MAGRQQITQANPAKHLGPDAISDRINDFGTILCRIDVHVKWPLAKWRIDHLHDGVRDGGFVVACDSISSFILEVEAGRGIALMPTFLRLIAGKRLLYRPLTGTTETMSVGIARPTKGDVTPAGEKFCEILRQTSVQMNEGEDLKADARLTRRRSTAA